MKHVCPCNPEHDLGSRWKLKRHQDVCTAHPIINKYIDEVEINKFMVDMLNEELMEARRVHAEEVGRLKDELLVARRMWMEERKRKELSSSERQAEDGEVERLKKELLEAQRMLSIQEERRGAESDVTKNDEEIIFLQVDQKVSTKRSHALGGRLFHSLLDEDETLRSCYSALVATRLPSVQLGWRCATLAFNGKDVENKLALYMGVNNSPTLLTRPRPYSLYHQQHAFAAF